MSVKGDWGGGGGGEANNIRDYPRQILLTIDKRHIAAWYVNKASSSVRFQSTLLLHNLNYSRGVLCYVVYIPCVFQYKEY